MKEITHEDIVAKFEELKPYMPEQITLTLVQSVSPEGKYAVVLQGIGRARLSAGDVLSKEGMYAFLIDSIEMYRQAEWAEEEPCLGIYCKYGKK